MHLKPIPGHRSAVLLLLLGMACPVRAAGPDLQLPASAYLPASLLGTHAAPSRDDECDEPGASAWPLPAGLKAAPAAAPAPAPAPAPPVWQLRASDGTLHAGLARWAAAAGWQLVWEVPADYAVESNTSIEGTFEEAVEKVTASMATAEVAMKAIFYKGNQVLRMVAKGVQ